MLGLSHRIGLLLLSVVFSITACAVQTPAVPGAVSDTYFGMHLHRAVVPQPWLPDGERLTPWPEAKFGSWRLWDAYVAWPNLEPQKGKWQFATLDKYVAMAQLAGVEVLLPLGLSPPWASARPSETSSYKPGNAAEPRDIEDWRNYVRTVATRYKGRIRAYEIWNEPNLKGFYTGTPEKLLELSRVAYETLKAVDPAITIVSPAVTGDGRHPEWLDHYLALGGGQYADVIAYHFYVPRQAPEAMLPVIAKVQHIMRKHNQDHKPLWNTETGWRIANKTITQRIGAAGENWSNLDDAQAAAYVARALVLGWAAGVQRFYWYAWDNVDMGLIDPADKSLKPAGAAYGRVREWMLGATFAGCNEDGSLWVCTLIRADGKPARIVWRTGGEALWQVPAAWQALTLETLAGDVRTFDGQQVVMLGQFPVLVR
ncbi:MAG: beta-galactosidase [Hydrogenophilaceae bacterium]|nr:beta-galactosidase [Hydrogenophilaceae bacterium]